MENENPEEIKDLANAEPPAVEPEVVFHRGEHFDSSREENLRGSGVYIIGGKKNIFSLIPVIIGAAVGLSLGILIGAILGIAGGPIGIVLGTLMAGIGGAVIGAFVGLLFWSIIPASIRALISALITIFLLYWTLLKIFHIDIWKIISSEFHL